MPGAKNQSAGIFVFLKVFGCVRCLFCLAVKFINSRMSSHRMILITFDNRLIFFGVHTII